MIINWGVWWTAVTERHLCLNSETDITAGCKCDVGVGGQIMTTTLIATGCCHVGRCIEIKS